MERLGLTYEGREVRRKEPLPSTLYQSDDVNAIINEANENRIDLHGITSGQIPGLAPIPVPGFGAPQDIPTVPGVNTIPGLKNFNYVVRKNFFSIFDPLKVFYFRLDNLFLK